MSCLDIVVISNSLKSVKLLVSVPKYILQGSLARLAGRKVSSRLGPGQRRQNVTVLQEVAKAGQATGPLLFP